MGHTAVVTAVWWGVWVLGVLLQLVDTVVVLRRQPADAPARFRWRQGGGAGATWSPSVLVGFAGWIAVLAASAGLADGFLAYGALLLGSVALVVLVQAAMTWVRNRRRDRLPAG